MKYDFYYVSLSDGDASLRVRFIHSPNFDKIYNQNNYSSTVAPCSTLHFIISGEVKINETIIHKGQAFYVDAYPKEKSIISYNHDTILLSFSFDGIHHRKLISDANIIPDSPSYAIDICKFDEILKIYQELLDIYPPNAPVDPPQILTQITSKQYLYRALHCLENENIMKLDTFRRKLLVDAESYMRNNFQKEISIEDVSEYLSIDRRYLYKLFKKYSGISPKQYLNNIRISRATELLLNSDLPITMIAEEVGYKDPLQFSTFFKKQTGFSPKKYRESL